MECSGVEDGSTGRGVGHGSEENGSWPQLTRAASIRWGRQTGDSARSRPLSFFPGCQEDSVSQV